VELCLLTLFLGVSLCVLSSLTLPPSSQHHCRLCGKIFCANCCPKNREIPFPHILNHNYPVRVCCRCYAVDPIDAHTAGVLTLHLMRTGEILSGSADGTVRVWEVMWEVDQTSGGQCIATLCGHTGDVTGTPTYPHDHVKM
jgi:hypothetical protein